MKPDFKILLSGLLVLLSLTGKAQFPASVYGTEESEIYRRQGIKEVRITREQFYQSWVSVPVHLHQRQLIDKNGRVTRQESAGGSKPQMAHRRDDTYDAKGALVTTTVFERETRPEGGYLQDERTPVTELTWVPYEQIRYQKTGKEKEGIYSWAPKPGKWSLTSTRRSYTKNDTTYTETQRLSYTSKEITRIYPLGNATNITRTDYLTYSPKGLGEPRYYYRKIENGRLAESGKVDFEMELYQYLETNPKSRLMLFGAKSNFHRLHDYVARQNPGTLQPTGTYTYNQQGHLIEETSYGTKTTYQRDNDGRILTEKVVHEDGSGRLVTYFYNEKGLLEKTRSKYLDGKPELNHFYEYFYY